MPSRLWLFFAFLVAFGTTPARAETGPKLVAVALGPMKAAKPPEGDRFDRAPSRFIDDTKRFNDAGGVISNPDSDAEGRAGGGENGPIAVSGRCAA